jgi:hypothetical protein
MDKRAFTSYDTGCLPGLGNFAQETLKRPQTKTMALLPLASVYPLAGSYLCALTSKLYVDVDSFCPTSGVPKE